MSTDAGSPIPSRPPFSTDLPRIVDMRIRRIEYQAPKLENFESSLSHYRDAIEFVVETDGPLPARAYGPALFVGDVEVDNSEVTGETTIRFLLFDHERLQPGTPITWGWMKDPEKRRMSTEFHYHVEG